MQPLEAFETLQDEIRHRSDTVVRAFGSPARFVYARPPKLLTGDDIPSLVMTLIRSPELSLSLPTLWDFRGQNFSGCTAGTSSALAFTLHRFGVPGTVRRGLLVDTDDGFGCGRMFQQIAEGHSLVAQNTFLVSYRASEIIAWLTNAAHGR